MSKAKCPLCGGDLIQSEKFPCFYSCQSTNWKSDADKLCELDDCAASVPVWESLRRTRKALEIATGAIDEILYLDSGKFCKEPAEMWKIAKSAKDQITAQEQKDVK